MKLNLGCANNKIKDWTNIDMDPLFEPDLCFDLTSPNWPISDDVVDEVMAIHILEHLEGTQGYLTFWKELYRVCKHNAEIKIEVPYWKHENFFHDPTHVRAVTPIGVSMFSQKRNHEDWMNGGKETKLGLMLKVDFELMGSQFTFGSGGDAELCLIMTKAVKPPRYNS
jgi:predicted SAM-dependent methyltransferase